MARNQNTACILLVVFIVEIVVIHGRVFSKSRNDFRIFQKPSVHINTDESFNRVKRELIENTTFTTNSDHAPVIHSQNSSLTSTVFTLQGDNDNQIVIHWTGEQENIVIVLTRKLQGNSLLSSTLWRSTDKGSSFVKVGLPVNFKVNHIKPSPADRNQIVLVDIDGQALCSSIDSGETWTFIQLHFMPYSVILHPVYKDLLLGYDLRQLKLFVSSDFGKSWSLLKERVTERIFWGVEGVDGDTRIVHMELQHLMGPVTYYACIAPACDPVNLNNSLGTIDFYSLIVQREYMFVQKSVGDVTSLYVSYKRGPFKKAFFPNKSQPLDFNIVDSSDDQVFIAVDHEDGVAAVYVSDKTGQFYVESMVNVIGLRMPGKFDVDIVKLEGLKGVYLLNRLEATDDVFAQRTYITYNKGGDWRLLDAPDEARHMCHDQNSCNLHLHLGYTNVFLAIPLAVTIAEAPGLIIAHGSVGTFLDIFSDHVFISRDAGVTWTTVPFVGKHYLSVLDQGSVLAAIPADSQETNQIHYSSTEGISWTSHNFSEEKMVIQGIVNQPGSKTLISSMFGRRNDSDDNVMVTVDYASVLSRKCDYTDFEKWSPSAMLVENEVHCLMGETMVIERRKQWSECYVGEDYKRTKYIHTCPCDVNDFECDFGYEMTIDGVGKHCEKTAWFDESSLPAPTCIHGKYNRSKGYRRVAGSSCEGGVSIEHFLPVEEDCPLMAPKGLSIYSPKTCVQRGVNVTFTLTQESGSELETTYTWSFGNGSDPITVVGLSNAAKITRTFEKLGRHNISVVAVNSVGKAEATIHLHVEEEIEDIFVEIPWGARAGMPSYFNVTVLVDDNKSRLDNDESLHFAWQFENKETGSVRHLTSENVIQQKFDHAGEYKLTLNVFNSISSVFYTQSVQVVENATTVRLHFSDEINNYNSLSLNIRQALAEILCHNIAQMLMIRRSRMIMSVPPTKPAVGDVTVLPPNPGELETYKVVKSLIDEAKTQLVSFPLFTRDDVVQIIDAGILDLLTGTEEVAVDDDVRLVTVPVPHNVTLVEERHSLLAVYISLPIVILVVITALTLILYYKHKLRSHKKYYPIVKHRSRIHHDSTCSCGEEDILGMEEPEDTIIPDNEYPDNEPTLMILNEPIDSQSHRASDSRH